MFKKSRNYNNNSVPLIQLTNVRNKTTLKPVKIFNKSKLLTNNPINKEKIRLNREISVSLFQDNEVNMVRNLNLDEEKNLCESLLYKGTVEKNMLNEEKMLSGSDNSKGISLPKIKTITVTNILESEKKLNENKKISLRNLANNQLEKELYENMENIKKKLKELKDKKYLLYRDYETKTKQIKDLNLEIEAFQTGQGESFLSKIFGLRISAPNINSETEKNTSKNLLETPMRLRKKSEQRSPEKKLASKTKSLIKNLWGQSKYEEKIQRIKMAYLAKKENDDKKMEKYRKIKQLKEDLKQIDTELTDINGQLTDLKTQDKETIKKLMRHYEALLYRGKDTRNDGLIWIIKAMWKLGKNVPMEFIPTFLDFNAIEFLFKLANKSIELENKKKLLNDCKKNLILKIHKLYFFNTNTDTENYSKKLFKGNNRRSSLLFKTNLIKRNSILKRSVSQTNIIKTYIHSSVDDEQRDEETNTFKDISKLVEKREKMDIEKMPGMDDIEELQKKIKSIENEIIELKNKEIIRIFKEFIENDYQNKYHVSIDVVLAALLGEHMKNIEVNKFAKFKKEYIESLKNIRFCEYRKKSDSK